MSERQSAIKPCEVPGKASVEDGVVLLDGPDGIAVAMTAEAAALTAESLREAAIRARAQAAAPAGKSDEAGSQ
jgi:hypothetical protein